MSINKTPSLEGLISGSDMVIWVVENDVPMSLNIFCTLLHG